jgi:hypothetical protein
MDTEGVDEVISCLWYLSPCQKKDPSQTLLISGFVTCSTGADINGRKWGKARCCNI